MPAPIVFRPQSGPLDSLLVNLFLGKIKHNQDLEIEKLKIEREKARLAESRKYKEGQTLAKEKRAKTTSIETENRGQVVKYKNKGWVLESQVKDPERKLTGMTKIVGGKVMYYPRTPNETDTHYPVWENDQWKMEKKSALKSYVDPNNPKKVVYRRPTEKPPEGFLPYSSPLVTVNTKPTIAEKREQENLAYFKSPKFSSDVIGDAKRLYGKMWDYYASEPQKQKELLRSIADAKVKAQFGSKATLSKDKDTGDVGWFVPEGNGHKLVVPWSE